MSGTIGKRFVASALATTSIAEWLSFGSIEHLFKPSEVELYGFVSEHVKKYGAMPAPGTIEAHLSEELAIAPEPPAYYHDLMQTRYVEQELKRGMKAAADKLGLTGKDPAGALLILGETVMQLIAKKNQRQVTDFRDAYDEIVTDYVAKYTSEDGAGLRLGWPTVDGMTGGLVRGDFMSLIGRPATGKTMQLLYAAHHGWEEQGACQMFISMEMKPLPIKQRLTAMHASIPATKLNNAELSSGYLAKMKASLLEVKGAKSAFWVVDGNFTSTVEDVWMMARQLKPDGIWIDGGYLLQHPRERDRFKRVAENAELIKQMLSDLAPTVVSWQFAKPPKEKKKQAQGLDDIGYSDAIAQVSSLVLGNLAQDSAETLMSRLIDILKGRKGETGKFRTHWDWVKMNFAEIAEEEVSELQYV
jgi:replicative DNA helicase